MRARGHGTLPCGGDGCLAGVLLVGLLAVLPAVTRLAEAASQTLDLKLLVISADGNETDLPHLTASLDRIGLPYDTLIATQTPLTEATLSSSDTHGKYYGVVLTTGNLIYSPDGGATYPSAFTPEQWTILQSYQAKFGVRSVTSFTFPEAAYGLTYAGYQDTLQSPLQASYTAAAEQIFGYVNTANQVPLSGAWLYLGTVIDPSVTTRPGHRASDGNTYPVASVTKFPDGRENLAITIANNPNLVHSLALSTGWINWVTRGLFLGERHASLDIQIDDLFSDNDLWDGNANTSWPATYRTTPPTSLRW